MHGGFAGEGTSVVVIAHYGGVGDLAGYQAVYEFKDGL